MAKWQQLGSANIPNDGGELRLLQRDREFSIRLSGIRGELMNSRVHGSEEALAEIGCERLKSTENARVLVGGLGMGFTLAAALRSLTSSASVTVAELIPEVVEWNRGPLGECAGRPLQDSRTVVHVVDIAELLANSHNAFDAILLDVDNGPEGLTHSDNDWLYSTDSLETIYRALRLKKARYHASAHMVRARPGKGSRHTIFLARKGALMPAPGK
jgi:spermidine synthase